MAGPQAVILAVALAPSLLPPEAAAGNTHVVLVCEKATTS